MKSFKLILIFIGGLIVSFSITLNILTFNHIFLSNTNLLETIASFSSLITILLFLIFIVGRYFMVNRAALLATESIDVTRDGSDLKNKITEEVNIEEGGAESIYLETNEPLRYLRVYELEFCETGSELKKVGEYIHETKDIKSGSVIKFNTYLPEGIPRYCLQYQRFDFIIYEIVLQEDGFDGNIERNVELIRTLRSYLYYIFK